MPGGDYNNPNYRCNDPIKLDSLVKEIEFNINYLREFQCAQMQSHNCILGLLKNINTTKLNKNDTLISKNLYVRIETKTLDLFYSTENDSMLKGLLNKYRIKLFYSIIHDLGQCNRYYQSFIKNNDKKPLINNSERNYMKNSNRHKPSGELHENLLKCSICQKRVNRINYMNHGMYCQISREIIQQLDQIKENLSKMINYSTNKKRQVIYESKRTRAYLDQYQSCAKKNFGEANGSLKLKSSLPSDRNEVQIKNSNQTKYDYNNVINNFIGNFSQNNPRRKFNSLFSNQSQQSSSNNHNTGNSLLLTTNQAKINFGDILSSIKEINDESNSFVHQSDNHVNNEAMLSCITKSYSEKADFGEKSDWTVSDSSSDSGSDQHLAYNKNPSLPNSKFNSKLCTHKSSNYLSQQTNSDDDSSEDNLDIKSEDNPGINSLKRSKTMLSRGLWQPAKSKFSSKNEKMKHDSEDDSDDDRSNNAIEKSGKLKLFNIQSDGTNPESSFSQISHMNVEGPIDIYCNDKNEVFSETNFNQLNLSELSSIEFDSEIDLMDMEFFDNINGYSGNKELKPNRVDDLRINQPFSSNTNNQRHFEQQEDATSKNLICTVGNDMIECRSVACELDHDIYNYDQTCPDFFNDTSRRGPKAIANLTRQNTQENYPSHISRCNKDRLKSNLRDSYKGIQKYPPLFTTTNKSTKKRPDFLKMNNMIDICEIFDNNVSKHGQTQKNRLFNLRLFQKLGKRNKKENNEYGFQIRRDSMINNDQLQQEKISYETHNNKYQQDQKNMFRAIGELILPTQTSNPIYEFRKKSILIRRRVTENWSNDIPGVALGTKSNDITDQNPKNIGNLLQRPIHQDIKNQHLSIPQDKNKNTYDFISEQTFSDINDDNFSIAAVPVK